MKLTGNTRLRAVGFFRIKLVLQVEVETTAELIEYPSGRLLKPGACTIWRDARVQDVTQTDGDGDPLYDFKGVA